MTTNKKSEEPKLGDCGICKKKDTEGETREYFVNFACTECIKIIDEWNSLDNSYKNTYPNFDEETLQEYPAFQNVKLTGTKEEIDEFLFLIREALDAE